MSSPQAMITLTGFTGEAFNYLLGKFAPIFDKYFPFVNEDGFIVKRLVTEEGLAPFNPWIAWGKSALGVAPVDRQWCFNSSLE